MNLKLPSPLKISTWHSRLGLALVLIPMFFTFFLLPEALHNLNLALIIAAVTCATMFVLSDLLAGNLDEGLWGGYLYFTVIVAWMAMGLANTLLIIVIGTIIAAFLRLVALKRLPAFPSGTANPQMIIELALARITMNGLAGLSVHLIYTLSNKSTPVTTITVEEIIALTPALLLGLMVTKLVAVLLLRKFPSADKIAKQQENLLLELLLLVVAPVASAVFSALGPVSFFVLMGVMGAQAIRYRQILTTQKSLMRRIEQLSTLDSLGHELASSIRIEDVLMTIYQRVSKITDVSSYYVALYDSRQDILEFPMVIEHDERTSWPDFPLQNAPLTAYVVTMGKALHVSQETRAYYERLNLPLRDIYTAFAGFPLLAGDKVLGALCIASGTRNGFTSDELSTIQTIAHQAGLMIRNAVLYNRSQKTTENLTLVNEFTQNVVFNMDIRAVLEAAAQATLKVATADRIAIFLPQPERRHRFQLAYSLNLTENYQEAITHWPYDQARYLDGPYIVIDTDSCEDATVRALAKIGEFKATAEIPMRSGSAVVGVIITYHNRPYYYRKTDLGLLETLANQVTAAVDNTELLKTLEAYASEQAQLVYLSRISTSYLDINMVINSVSSLMQTIMEAQRIYIGLLDEPKETVAFYGINSDRKQYPAATIPEIMMHHAIPQYFSRENASPGLIEVMEECGDTGIALASLVANNHNLGVVALGTPGKFTDSEARLLELATNQVAAQIHNAQQFGFVQDALNRRLEQLAFIEDIARQISSALNVEQLIGNVLDAAARATQADMVVLALLTDDNVFQIIGQELIEGQWRTRHDYRAANQGVMGRVAQTGKHEIITDNNLVPDYISTFSPGLYRSSLVVPLLKDQTPLGVLNIESTQVNFFTEEHVDFILSLAGHAVITIQNMRLLQERQRQIETLTGLRELSLRLSSNPDRRSVGNAILRTALDMTDGETAFLFQYIEGSRDVPLISSLSRNHNLMIEPLLPYKLLQRAAETNTIQIVADIHNHEIFANYAYLDELKYGSLIAAPIKHGSHDYEILCILFSRPRPALENHMNTLELLTIQAAGHLENTRLYEKVLAGNNRMRAILDASSDGVILLDRNGNLIESNVSAEHILSIDLEDAIGENFVELLLRQVEGEETANIMVEGMQNMARILRLEPQRITRRQYEHKRYDHSMYIEEIGSPVMDGKGEIMGRLIVLRDITEQRELEAYREEITNMVVHDLRSPLAGIITSLTMAEEVAEQDLAAPDILKPVLDISINNAHNLMELVNTILDIAKRESADWTLNTTALSVEELIQSSITMISPLIQEAKLSLEEHFPSHAPFVNADSNEIRRVMFNLLDNAIRYSPSGGKIWVGTELVEKGTKVLVRVANTGKPIPVEERERIFEKFRQVPGNAPLHGRKGSGLGLNFCKLVIEAHGGKIWVESEGPLDGASFVFTLPVVAEPVNGSP